jgi:hypothetical protein
MIVTNFTNGFVQIIVSDDKARSSIQSVQFRISFGGEKSLISCIENAANELDTVRSNYHDSKEAMATYHRGSVQTTYNTAGRPPYVAIISFESVTITFVFAGQTLVVNSAEAAELVKSLIGSIL